MGTSKTELFTEAQNELAKFAKLFSHPARIAILQELLASTTCLNGQLSQTLGLAQSTVNQHLKELKQAGLIVGTLNGVNTNYCLNPKKWEEIQGLLGTFINTSTKNMNTKCC